MTEKLDFPRSWLIQRLLKDVMRSKCNCEIIQMTCHRCELLNDAEKFFPTEFAKQASWVVKHPKPRGSRD